MNTQVKSFKNWVTLIESDGPTCPRCGSEMKLRNGPRGSFWGCTKWRPGNAGCKGTVDAGKPTTPSSATPSVTTPVTPMASAEPTPPCPKCGGKMILRTNKMRGNQFYGCSQFPKCNGTMGYSANFGQFKKEVDVEKERSGIIGEPKAIRTGENPFIPADQKPESPEKYKIPADKMSPEQRKIEEEFNSSDKNLVINALAGTGKTTMLKHLAANKKPGEKWLYLVFNKKNERDAVKSFPKDGIEVATTHSFLGRVLSENSKQGRIPETALDDAKLGDLMHDKTDHWWNRRCDEYDIPYSVRWPIKTRAKRLAELGKSFAYHPISGEKNALKNLIKKYSIDASLDELKDTINPKDKRDYTEEIVELAHEALHQSMPHNAANPALHRSRDHDDTLWYAATHADKLAWPQYSVVLADEVQDFNNCQKIMLKKLHEAGARIIAVGDPNQAIYMFRGADNNAFKDLESMLGATAKGVETLDLPTNYRCGKKIIDYANGTTKVKNLKAGMGHEGEVTDDKKYSEVMDDLNNEWHQNGNKLLHQTAFICRTNRPLIHAALSLMRSNMNFTIIGKNFADDLVEHVREITGKGIRRRIIPINNLEMTLQSHLDEKERQWRQDARKQGDLKELKETTEALSEVLGYLGEQNFHDESVKMDVRNSDDFIQYLKKRFSGLDADRDADAAEELEKKDPKSHVILTTAHRSKGAEFDRVYILRNDLFPHTSAKTADEKEQEENCRYVSYTRARNQLHILNDKEPGGNKEK